MINEDCIRSMVKQAGGIFVGIQQTIKEESDLILFNDPVTDSTVSVPINIATVSVIKAKLLRSRMKFDKVEKGSDLYLEVQEIRNSVNALLVSVCCDAEALENLMNVLSRLDVLIHYLKAK